MVRDRPDLTLSSADFHARSALFLLLDTEKLRLVPLYGDAATRMRLDAADLMGKDYRYKQALAKLIHDHADGPDGIVYRSRFDSATTAVVLFHRAVARGRLFPGSGPVKFGDVEELTAAVRSTVPYCLV